MAEKAEAERLAEEERIKYASCENLSEEWNDAALMQAFGEFVMDEFDKMELDPKIKRRYAVANPAGMSALGLKRYWVKKQQKELGGR